MPTVRYGSPWIAGMAGGIPSATQGILDVLRLREAQHRADLQEAYQNRMLALSEATGQRTADEAARQQALRQQFGQNATTVSGFLSTLRPALTPAEPPAPAFAEPFVSGAEGMLPPAGGAVGPIRPAQLGSPATITTPSLGASLLADPTRAAAFFQMAEANPAATNLLVAGEKNRLQEEKDQLRLAESNRLMGEAGKVLGSDPVLGFTLMARAGEMIGKPITEKQITDLVANDPEQARIDAKFLAPYAQAAQGGDPTAVMDLMVAATGRRTGFALQVADSAHKLWGMLPGMAFLDQVRQQVDEESKALPAGATLPPERFGAIAEALAAQSAGNLKGFRDAYAGSTAFKARYDLATKVTQEQATGVTAHRTAETKYLETRTKELGTERPAERKERIQAEARAGLEAYRGGTGPELSPQQLLELYEDAGLGVPQGGVLSVDLIQLQAARKAAKRGGGSPASAPAPASAQGFDSLPDPAQHVGKGMTDTATGKHYRSNGVQWIEVK